MLSERSLETAVSGHANISQSLNPASSHLTTCQFSPSHPVFQSAIFDRAASFVQILCNVNDEGSEFFAYLYQPAYQKNCVLACPFLSSLFERDSGFGRKATLNAVVLPDPAFHFLYAQSDCKRCKYIREAE